jgi:uncharacterized repeat protein (TIGR03806 family)
VAIVAAVVLAQSKPGEPSYGIEKRVPWTASRVKGSPEAPLPYVAERVFPKLKFSSPVDIMNAPGTDRLFVVEQYGSIYSFRSDPAVEKPDLFVDLKKDIRGLEKFPEAKGVRETYALAFHPDFEKNRYCYVCYIMDPKQGGKRLENGSRVSRFTVTKDDPPKVDPTSEVVTLEWVEGGHNGACLKFGPDGYLYVSTGDAESPNPPDPRSTGQDVSDLLSSILRIDVNRTDAGTTYAIPPDNPFVKLEGARPEVWAYGFRNPWRMSFDAAGNLWAADVGWELWEMVYRIERGGNYGWSVTEGPQPVKPNDPVGPTPILPPALALPHTESASITGGFVYRGKRLPELQGHYVFGDWETRRVWASKVEGTKLLSHRDLAHTDLRIVGFTETNDGEIYVLDYEGGGIHQLSRNEAVDQSKDFPRRLSDTGLFSSVKDHVPAPGVVPFSVNVPQWLDHAVGERFVAIPGAAGVTINKDQKPVWPKDSVLVRTLSMDMEAGKPATRKRLETQLLHFDGRQWRGYSYRWNEAQTDAELVEAGGAEQSLVVTDVAAPGGRREQTWRFPSRTQCMTCHNPWADVTLGFTLPQLDRAHDYNGIIDNQVRTLGHIGVLPAAQKGNQPKAMASLDEQAGSVEERARTYLHVNCSHCHRFGGGGTALIDLRYDIKLSEMKTVTEQPNQGTFAIADARIIDPGNPARSVLLYRMAKLGHGRMPQLGSEIVDDRAVTLMAEWIGQMRPPAQTPANPSIAAVCDDPDGSPTAIAAIDRLLTTTDGALDLVLALETRQLAEAVRHEVIARGTAHPQPAVRDLFERFLPPERRIERLGIDFKPAKLLSMKGDAKRGREVFFEFGGGLCKQCHQINGEGENFGPDLSRIATKYDHAQLLDQILHPSKSVEPQYVTYLVKTAKDDYTGFIVSRTDEEIVLKDAQKQEIRLRTNDVQKMTPQAISTMPEGLLGGLTAQQAADLLEYLTTLK